eukprot:s916_g4.t2
MQYPLTPRATHWFRRCLRGLAAAVRQLPKLRGVFHWHGWGNGDTYDFGDGKNELGADLVQSVLEGSGTHPPCLGKKRYTGPPPPRFMFYRDARFPRMPGWGWSFERIACYCWREATAPADAVPVNCWRKGEAALYGIVSYESAALACGFAFECGVLRPLGLAQLTDVRKNLAVQSAGFEPGAPGGEDDGRGVRGRREETKPKAQNLAFFWSLSFRPNQWDEIAKYVQEVEDQALSSRTEIIAKICSGCERRNATGFDGKGSQEFLGLSGAPQKHRRLNLNAFAVVLNLLLPWVVFSAICWALSFSLHYKAPLVAGGREIRHASRLVGEVAFLFHRGHVSSCPDRNGMWRVEFQDAHFGRLRLEQHEHLPCCESCRSQGAAADGRRPRLLLGRKRPRLEESYELQGLGHPSLWARIRWRPMTTGLSA